MFCELTKCSKIILGPKIVVRLSYMIILYYYILCLWIGSQVPFLTPKQWQHRNPPRYLWYYFYYW